MVSNCIAVATYSEFGSHRLLRNVELNLLGLYMYKYILDVNFLIVVVELIIQCPIILGRVRNGKFRSWVDCVKNDVYIKLFTSSHFGLTKNRRIQDPTKGWATAFFTLVTHTMPCVTKGS